MATFHYCYHTALKMLITDVRCLHTEQLGDDNCDVDNTHKTVNTNDSFLLCMREVPGSNTQTYYCY